MGILCFVCPPTGNTVSTNLEIDADSFSTCRTTASVPCSAWIVRNLMTFRS